MFTVDFDRPAFESLMGQAVEQHNVRHNHAAHKLREEAYMMAPTGSTEAGRAARDLSASADRLGRRDEAAIRAQEAFNIHDSLLQDHPTRQAYRERAASTMYLGVSGLRKVLRGYVDGAYTSSIAEEMSALDLMRRAWRDIQQAKTQAPEGINQEIDQYEVNAARRVSIAESLLGNRKRGLAIGAYAVGLSVMSESPLLDTSESRLTRMQRIKSKLKAFAGGVAAVGVGILVSDSKTPARDYLAYKLAERTI